jgi:hypothetical protein
VDGYASAITGLINCPIPSVSVMMVSPAAAKPRHYIFMWIVGMLKIEIRPLP